MLVAGTCIGSGMIALPLVFAKSGLVVSVLLMLIMWAYVYYTSLISLELNLQAGHGLDLGELGKKYSGHVAATLGRVCIKILSFALLAVYIYGGSSIMHKLLEAEVGTSVIAAYYALGATAFFMLPIKLVDYCNRALFLGLLAVIAILVAGLVSTINWDNLPLFTAHERELSMWRTLLPVVFTSFGFQMIAPTLTNYCQQNPAMLKRAFFWGCLIPAIVYIVWTCSTISVLYNESPEFYQQMLAGNTEVGDLIKQLSLVAKWQSVQMLVWWISLLAIVTSLLGVGVGLCDSIKHLLTPYIKHNSLRNLTAAILTMLPSYIVASLVPNAFIAVLGFAGMILLIIAILLPIHLLRKAKPTQFFYPELKHRRLIAGAAMIGLAIIGCELANMLL